jgi:hypothetical protein
MANIYAITDPSGRVVAPRLDMIHQDAEDLRMGLKSGWNLELIETPRGGVFKEVVGDQLVFTETA